MIARTAEICPESLRQPRVVHLIQLCRKEQLPLRDGFGAILGFEISKRQFIVNIRTRRRKLQRVLVLLDGFARVSQIHVVVTERKIGVRRGRAVLQFGRKEILRRALPRIGEIFAVARGIIAPDISRQLNVAVNLLADPLRDGLISESVHKRRIDSGFAFRKVEADQGRVRLAPNRWA